MRHIVLCVVGIAPLLVVAVACSKTDTERTDPSPKGTSASERSPVDETVSTPPSTAPTPTAAPAPPPAPACSNAQGADACYECCDARHAGGAQRWDQAMQACVCAATACGVQCAQTACAEPPVVPVAGDACSACLDSATACEQQADTACAADPACNAFAACVEASECEPPVVDGGQ